jgi:hypothetical protein
MTSQPTNLFWHLKTSQTVARNNHTNIILVNIPHRYDTTDTITTTDNIEKFNKKLEKLIKVSPNLRFLKLIQIGNCLQNMDSIITDWESNT